MMQVRNTTDPKLQPSLVERVTRLFDIFVPMDSMLVAARAVGVFVLTIGTIFGGGLVSAQVTRDAQPGNSFYNMKLAVERLQLTLAPNGDYRTRLHTDFADRRVDEIARLAETPNVDAKVASQVISGFTNEVAALQSELEASRADNPTEVAEVAKLMERKMAVYSGVLRSAGVTLPSSSRRDLAIARNLVDGMTISAMAVLVEKNAAGDVHASGNVVASKFEARVEQAEARIGASTVAAPKTVQAKAALAEAKELLKNENYQAALTKMVEVAELTKEDETDTTTDTIKECTGDDCPKEAPVEPPVETTTP